MTYRWDWGVLWREPYFGWLVTGLINTILLGLAAWIIALFVGTLVGIARTSEGTALRAIGTAYVQLFRNIPLLVQMFVWFFVVPELLPKAVGDYIKRDLPYPAFVTAMVALGLYTASRVGEQVRAGIAAAGGGARLAALSVGLTPFQAYRHVLVPVAFRKILLPLTSEFLSVVKNSSLALTIGVLELTAQARRIESETFHGFEAFLAATVLYLLVTFTVLAAMRRLDRRMAMTGMIGREAHR
jgi:glutamate/aspartate transport system permease protein